MSAPIACPRCIERGSEAHLFASKLAYNTHLTSGFIDGMQVCCQDPLWMLRADDSPVLVQNKNGHWVRNRNESLDEVRDRLRRSLRQGWDAARTEERRCQECTNVLQSPRPNARYCSPACRQRGSRRRKAGRADVTEAA